MNKQKIVEKWEEIKKRYPDICNIECNIEGLEPALTSDILELIDLAIKEERERIVEMIKNTQGYVSKLPEIDPSLGELTDYDIDFVKDPYGQIIFKAEIIKKLK